MAVKLGVGGKLLLIMTSTVALVLVVAVLGVFGYVQVANKQNSVIDDTIPAIVSSHNLNLANSSLVNTVPSISKATSLAEVEALSATFEAQLDVFVEVVEKFQDTDYANDNTAELLVIVQRIEHNLHQQLSWKTAQLNAESLYLKHVSEATRAINAVESISTTLVANANTATAAITSGLYDLVETDKDQLYDTFDRLIDIDLDHMERMYELRKRAASLTNLLFRLNSTTSYQEVAAIKLEIMADLHVLERRISEINDPGRRQQASNLLQQFITNLMAVGDYSLFDLRTQMLLSDINQQSLAAGVKSYIEDFNKQVIMFSSGVSEGLITSTTEARTAVDLWRNLVFFVSISIVVLGMAFLWLYLRRSLFRPLDSVNNALLSVAKGDLSAEVNYSRDDVIGRLSRTVEVFKNNASVRLELEKKQEIVERRLRNHQQDLEQQIQQRTLELQTLNDRLTRSVDNHMQAREEAEQANQAKTAFLATMSHEIRTPLGGIIGTLRLLGRTSVNEQQQEYVAYSLEAAEALLLILNGILDFAKVETEEISIATTACNMQQITATLKVLMQPIADDKGIDLSFQISKEVDDQSFMIDKGKIHQILFNLLSNAIKFTPSGFVELSVTQITVDDQPVLRFEVEDTGLGIPSESRARLFQPFTQYDSSTEREYGGTGLGLSICDKLVRAMRGRIGIDSRVTGDYTQGTSFWVEIPCEMVDLTQTPSADHDVDLDGSVSKRILLIEDNKITRIVTEGYLLQMGHTVECAVDGHDALNFADQEYDVILMDISMPGMDGVETAMRMRRVHQEQQRYIPIIAMSAHIFPQEIEEFLRAGMDGFIAKPIDLQRFMLVLQDIKNAEVKPVSLLDEHVSEVLNESVLQADLGALGSHRMREMIALYRTSSEELFATLSAAFRAQDWAAVADHAHTLKNAAGSLGLESLHDLTNQLELKAKQSETDSMTLIMDDLEELATKSYQALMTWQRIHLATEAGE